MPDANFQFVTSVTFLGRDIPLTKPIAVFNARRLEALLPQIAALNAARKTKGQAAAVLGVTQQTLATWIKITQTTWLGKVRQPKNKGYDPVKHRAYVKAWRQRNREKHLAMKRSQYINRKARLAPTQPKRVGGWSASYEINGVKMSKLKHDRIRAFEKQLPQLDERERLGADDIAARLGITGSCIRQWLRILGHRLHNHNGRTIYRHDHTGWEQKILPVYKATGYMAGKTAETLGMDKSVVYRWLANNGHLKRKHAERDISKFKFQNYR